MTAKCSSTVKCSSCFDESACLPDKGTYGQSLHRRMDSRQSDGIFQVIEGRVMVTMQNKVTIRTDELPLIQRHLVHSPAFITSLTAPSGLGILDELSTACYCFVGEQIIEPSPRRVEDMLGEIALDHVVDVQVLADNDFIFLGHRMTQLVQEVSPLVSDFQISSCDIESGFAPIIASFDSSAEDSLQSSQLLFSMNVQPRIFDNSSFVVSQEVLQSDIDTYLLFGRMNNIWNIEFATECGEPLIGIVLLDGQGLDFPFGDSMQNNWDASYFGESKSCIGEKLESGLRISYALNLALEARISFSFAGLDFDSSEEVVESLRNSGSNILKNLTKYYLAETIITNLHLYDEIIEIKLASDMFSLIEGKKFVVGLFADGEVIEKPDLLFGSRVDSVAVPSEELHGWSKVLQIFKPYGHMSSGNGGSVNSSTGLNQ